IEEIGEGCSNAKLIEVVQSLPEIWDKDHEKYRSSIKASYWKIMSGTPTGGPLLKRRWETLIRGYQRERRKYVASASAGPGVTPLFPEYSMLGFLDKITDDSGKRADSSTICSAASSKSEDVISLDDIDDEFDSNVTKAAASKPAAKPVTDRNLLKRKKKDGEDDELGNLIDKIGTLVDKEYAKNESSRKPRERLGRAWYRSRLPHWHESHQVGYVEIGSLQVYGRTDTQTQGYSTRSASGFYL
ncbi:hypothetical protein PFISCL1PPCAC_19850, partial [Pristionchus fissidentatus]